MTDQASPDLGLGPPPAPLLAATDAFASAPALAPHAVFGAFTRDAYDRYHAMHLADHLSIFRARGEPFTP